jgi:hypothetical protein
MLMKALNGKITEHCVGFEIGHDYHYSPEDRIAEWFL